MATKKKTTLKKEGGLTDKVKVRFLKSPAGVYRIAAEKGRIKEFVKQQAEELINNGFAELV